MKLSEILEQVDTLIPNSINVSTKVTWINHVQNQLFRDYPVPESIEVFRLYPNQKFYLLPGDCPSDRITELVINDKRYPFLGRGVSTESEYSHFCTIVSETLMIHPAPSAEGDGFLFYKARPRQFSASNMATKSSFPSDFEELLVLGCASRVAKSDPQTANMGLIFDNDFARLAEKADLVIQKARQPSVNIVKNWM